MSHRALMAQCIFLWRRIATALAPCARLVFRHPIQVNGANFHLKAWKIVARTSTALPATIVTTQTTAAIAGTAAPTVMSRQPCLAATRENLDNTHRGKEQNTGARAAAATPRTTRKKCQQQGQQQPQGVVRQTLTAVRKKERQQQQRSTSSTRASSWHSAGEMCLCSCQSSRGGTTVQRPSQVS